jgi:hypothetical protein
MKATYTEESGANLLWFMKDPYTQDIESTIHERYAYSGARVCYSWKLHIFRKQVLHQNAVFHYVKCTPKLTKSHKKP